MKKRDKVILSIFVLLLIVLAVVCIVSLKKAGPETSDGIVVTGNTTGYEFEASHSKQLIHIKSNGLAISGNAQTDTHLIIYPNVSVLDISGLKQNEWKIHIESDLNREETEMLEITYSGDNEICLIDGPKSISLKSSTSKDKLVLTAGIYAENSIYLQDGHIVTGYLDAFECIKLMGNIDLHVKKSRDETLNDDLYVARIDGTTLYIDLQENGRIAVEDCGNDNVYYTIYVNEIVLGKNVILAYPKKGHVANYNSGDVIYSSDASVFNEDGTDCEKVVFEYRE